MIVWLASYPRSGNTLLRTVLKQTMGLGSYSDEDDLFPEIPSTLGHSPGVKTQYGHLPVTTSWDTFYNIANAEPKLFLVKTHLLPQDDQAAIYVVRDGRAVIDSYHAFHRTYHSQDRVPPSYLDLILGNDYYGNWSSHYQAWARRDAPCMVVRYEHLIRPEPYLLGQIAEFVKYDGDVAPFQNPFNELQQDNSGFFRRGESIWQRSEHWSDELEMVFLDLHGEVMEELQYIDKAERAEVNRRLSPVLKELAAICVGVLEERNRWKREAEAKERVIQDLAQAASKQAESKWLGLINRLLSRLR